MKLRFNSVSSKTKLQIF